MDASARIIAFVGTRNAERAKEFYRGMLGLNLVSEDPFALVFDVGGTMLRVTPVRDLSPAGFTVLGWEVKDITAAVQGLQKAGVMFERYNFPQDELGIWTAPGGAKVAWFKDPDGNVLSLSQH
jgi:catechol 2,3-dioxygenase-like lactoylglutathione lyase family enzyme